MARPVGAVAKRSMTLAAFLETKGCNPSKILSDLTKSIDPEMQFKAANSLMPYVWPKLATVEVKGDLSTTTHIGIEPEAIEAIAKILASRRK